MKIALTLKKNNSKSSFASLFGRCSYIMIVNTLDNSEVFIKNPYSSSIGSSGIQTTKLLVENNCEILITKSIGSQALMYLNSVGIKVYTSSEKTAYDSINLFNKGRLELVNNLVK